MLMRDSLGIYSAQLQPQRKHILFNPTDKRMNAHRCIKVQIVLFLFYHQQKATGDIKVLLDSCHQSDKRVTVL